MRHKQEIINHEIINTATSKTVYLAMKSELSGWSFYLSSLEFSINCLLLKPHDKLYFHSLMQHSVPKIDEVLGFGCEIPGPSTKPNLAR